MANTHGEPNPWFTPGVSGGRHSSGAANGANRNNVNRIVNLHRESRGSLPLRLRSVLPCRTAKDRIEFYLRRALLSQHVKLRRKKWAKKEKHPTFRSNASSKFQNKIHEQISASLTVNVTFFHTYRERLFCVFCQHG